MIKIAILAIGNEIVNGDITDTNSSYIAKKLRQDDYGIGAIYALPDKVNVIRNMIEKLSENYDIILTTGGLGPTFDDLTTEACALAAKQNIKLKKKLYKPLISTIKSKGVKLKITHLKQIYLPENADVIPNDYGTAPGFCIKINRALVASMPGVPFEMKHMFESYIFKMIKKLYPQPDIYKYDLKFAQLPESDADSFIRSQHFEDVDIILNAMSGELAVRLSSIDKTAIESVREKITKRFKDNFYSDANESLEEVVLRILGEKKLTLAVVENFTGGYLTKLLSSKNGFSGSIITNDNSISMMNKAEDLFGADIVICPHSRDGDKFKVSILFKDTTETADSIALSRNYQEYASKITLGYLYRMIRKA